MKEFVLILNKKQNKQNNIGFLTFKLPPKY